MTIGGTVKDLSTAGSIAAILGFALGCWAAFRRLHLVKIEVKPVISDNFGENKVVDWKVDRQTVRDILEEFYDSGDRAYGADAQLYLWVRLTVRGLSQLTLEKVQFWDTRSKRIVCQRKASGIERVKIVPGEDHSDWKFYLDELDKESQNVFSKDPSSLRLRVRFIKANGRTIRKLRTIPNKGLANVVSLFAEEKERLESEKRPGAQ